MVKIFYGDVNNGKTTALVRNYIRNQKGYGVASIKTLEDGGVKCYDALELSTGNLMRLAYHEKFRPETFISDMTLGPYSFDKDVFENIEASISLKIEAGVKPIYIDEVGVLELSGKGFAKVLNQLVQNDVDSVIAVRSDLVEKVIKTFGIKEYQLISVLGNEGEGCTT